MQMQTFCAGLHTIVNDKGKDATVQERTRLYGAFVALQCRKKSLNQSVVTRHEILKALWIQIENIHNFQNSYFWRVKRQSGCSFPAQMIHLAWLGRLGLFPGGQTAHLSWIYGEWEYTTNIRL